VNARKATEKQARLLRVLAGGSIVLVPMRRGWMPIVRRGWVETTNGEHIPPDGQPHGSYLPPLRITPDGLRALADATEAGVIEAVTIKGQGTS